eukprot:7548093-Pyramimonas_sp.AAC.1
MNKVVSTILRGIDQIALLGFTEATLPRISTSRHNPRNWKSRRPLLPLCAAKLDDELGAQLLPEIRLDELADSWVENPLP